MVKRWQDEILLGLVLMGCSALGGFFGAKMAQIDGSETFGRLPPPCESIMLSSEQPPPVIVIVVNDSRTSGARPEAAIYTLRQPLNLIQKTVNFI
ncbi:MAG: hypothetical protein KF760_20555 [Candidatus Eremiobacteraeota bacterium]|nr:hypothetical protein [Candidatus Eremiobacteraeota bacterium]MCW5867759.1 hypothetical protein [Candidatus Eremiobacteraeota bacterium]